MKIKISTHTVSTPKGKYEIKMTRIVGLRLRKLALVPLKNKK